MTTANVKLIVRDYGARHIVRDHRKAVRAIRAGRLCNLFAAYQRTRVAESESTYRSTSNFNLLGDRRNLQLHA